MSIAEFGLLLAAVLSGTIGQFFLKAGAGKLGVVTSSNFLRQTLGVFVSPDVLVGLVFYGAGAVLYILLLTRLPLSIVGPSVAVQYIFALLVGYFFFHEPIPLVRVVGLGLIVSGVILVIQKN
jgi:drug/metabolite transporter (DMT)-like permease